MAYDKKMLEEELKHRVAEDYFSAYDPHDILGRVDFAVRVPMEGKELFEPEYFYWAEAKKGSKERLEDNLVQLILTIGKERTFDKYLPPAFLGAFDAEKICFLPYNSVLDIFYQNDFNWNVAPSDHSTKEFKQVEELVSDTLKNGLMIFRFGKDDKELRTFIRKNFICGKSKIAKTRINKNNFTVYYQKWLDEVKPTIAIDWEKARKRGIYPSHFYLADILSEHNLPLIQKLFVVLREDHYELDRKIDELGLFNSKKATFNDEQVAHKHFWNRFNRPPKREYWDYIINRQDLLVPQYIRETRGAYFTPQKWVELSQQYLEAELGENWQQEYYIWDCAAGTGNLLAGLTEKYRIFASTIDQWDVDGMHERIKMMNDQSSSGNGSNLLDSHVFQFDFLNDPLLDYEDEDGQLVRSKLPSSLQDILRDPEKCRKLVIYINPPYVEATNARTIAGKGNHRTGISSSYVKLKYRSELGRAVNEVFAQFFARVVREIPNSILAVFSTLKTLQGPNFAGFRNEFRARLGRIFIVPANTFDNVKGDFPIGFQIWHTSETEEFKSIEADVYDEHREFLGTKNLYSYKDQPLILKWIQQYYDREHEHLAYLRFLGTDFQHSKDIFLTLKPYKTDLEQVKGNWVTEYNLLPMVIYFTVRHCIPATWLNDRDQFLFPNPEWQNDELFHTNCLTYAIFHGQNRISSKHGMNNWIPFTESDVNAKEVFKSHFLTDFISGRNRKPQIAEGQLQVFSNPANPLAGGNSPLCFSKEAADVFKAARELWKYYHQQSGADPNAAYYDIRLHFQGIDNKGRMNSGSDDERYNQLIATLKQSLKSLSIPLEAQIYKYGFLMQ